MLNFYIILWAVVILWLKNYKVWLLWVYTVCISALVVVLIWVKLIEIMLCPLRFLGNCSSRSHRSQTKVSEEGGRRVVVLEQILIIYTVYRVSTAYQATTAKYFTEGQYANFKKGCAKVQIPGEYFKWAVGDLCCWIAMKCCLSVSYCIKQEREDPAIQITEN